MAHPADGSTDTPVSAPAEAAQRRLVLREAEIGAERVVGIVRMLTAALLGIVFYLAVRGLDPREDGELARVVDRQHGLAIATVAAYFLVGALSVAVARPSLFRPWLPWLSAGLDVAFILTALLISLRNTGLGTNYVFAMPTAWLIPVILGFGAQRFNAPLQLATTLAIAVGLAAVPALAGGWQMFADGTGPVDLFFAFPPDAMRIAMILAAGFALVVAVLRTHRLLDRMAGEIRMRTALTRYLPAELAPLLAGSDGGALRFSRRQQVAILFIDIRGFTARAERATPEELTAFVTAYRHRVQRAATRHGAIIDKHIGDAAMLLFGVTAAAEAGPAPAARAALACGQDLLREIAGWNTALAAAGEAPVAVGIGVHVGEVYCGTVGDAERLEFTVLGDTVNVAARLEAMTKRLGTPLLASEAAIACAGAAAEGWQALGEQPIAGRDGGIALYAPPAS
ncbi:MAG: adenylate/guanylate cyclase domain-containing protein [Sneathiellaceae bacterium]